MKTTFTILSVLILALPLAYVPPLGAQAQANDPTAKPAITAERGRQAISNKLERIRFDRVAYDGLPLGEVVRALREESKLRDPEKKGVNFMLNPNAPVAATLPGAQPVEAIDVASILIRIRPPLSDVRLLDVLDAIVKVADHPIRYAIEDYGVVMSAAEFDAAPKDETVFSFGGGTPNAFLDSIQKQFGVEWSSVVDIPREMADVRIPRLRLTQQSLAALARRPGGTNNPLGALISLYNQLGEQKRELGRLIVQGDLAKPSVVAFVPDKTLADAQPKLKTRAFSIHGINDADRKKLLEDIERAKQEAFEFALHNSSSRALDGAVAIHSDTGLLVATGSEPFVEMVESIVNACQDNAKAGRFPAK